VALRYFDRTFAYGEGASDKATLKSHKHRHEKKDKKARDSGGSRKGDSGEDVIGEDVSRRGGPDDTGRLFPLRVW
jgi:hypothetical protein